MQLIAESYLLLKYVGGFNNQELAHIFKSWNDGELHSYLIGITAGIFRELTTWRTESSLTASETAPNRKEPEGGPA